MNRTKVLIAALAVTLLAAPAEARKVTNPDWQAWQQSRTTFCAVVKAAGFRTPRVCRAGV